MQEFDMQEFIKGLKEAEKKQKEIADKNCKKGIHTFGPAHLSGGRIHNRCSNCSFTYSVEDKPMTL